MFDSIQPWLSKHPKIVIFTTVAITAIGISAVILIGGKKIEIPIEKLTEHIASNAVKIAKTVAPDTALEVNGVLKTFPRNSFIRKLPEGWKASAAKIAEAQRLNIALKPGETLVDACIVAMRKAA